MDPAVPTRDIGRPTVVGIPSAREPRDVAQVAPRYDFPDRHPACISLVAMKTIRPLLPLMILILLAGCQTAKAPPSDLAGATRDRERSTAVVAIEPPDRETLSAPGLPPPPEQFVPVPRLADIHFDYDAYTIRPEDTSILDENAAWIRTNPEWPGPDRGARRRARHRATTTSAWAICGRRPRGAT